MPVERYEANLPPVEAVISPGRIGDLRAAGPLCGLLKSRSQEMRDAASRALIRLGEGAVPALIAALESEDDLLRSGAADTLVAIGLPDDSDVRARLAVARRDWDTAVSIGAAAAGPIIDVIKGKDEDAKGLARQALARIETSDTMACAWRAVIRRRWASAVRLGVAATDALVYAMDDALDRDDLKGCARAIQALGEVDDGRAVNILLRRLEGPISGWEWRELRKTTAAALVKIYRSGRLDEESKLRILAARDDITRPHTDETSSSCGGAQHNDYGTGVAFD